jgi:HEAT repeat protein
MQTQRLLVFLILVGGLGLWVTQQSYSEDDLSKIKRTISDKSYANYWDRLRAINKLRKINTKEAAVILVSLFNDDEAPIREASVIALGTFRDQDTIEYLVSNPLINPKSKKERFHTAWTLGLIKNENSLSHLLKALNNEADEEVAVRMIETISQIPENSSSQETLINRLSDSRLRVVASAIQTLGKMQSLKAYPLLLKKAYEPNLIVKIAALEALSDIKPQGSVFYLESALNNAPPEIKIVVLEMFTKHKIDKSLVLKYASILLTDKSPAVSATVVKCLREMREKEAVGILIERLDNNLWRLRYDIVSALKDLTGQPFGFQSSIWKNWYEANKDRIELSLNKPTGLDLNHLTNPSETIPTFFDIPVLGKNIIFIIDFSGSMKYEQETEGGRKEPKIDIAIRELSNTLKALPPETKFNIIILSTEATRLNKREVFKSMLPATDNNKKGTLDFIKSLWQRLEDIKRGRADHYDALMEAINKPEIDTIFLLSDGKPSYGTYMDDDNIIENIAKNNRFKKVVIHTILTGKKGINLRLMERLAQITNGVCVCK